MWLTVNTLTMLFRLVMKYVRSKNNVWNLKGIEMFAYCKLLVEY